MSLQPQPIGPIPDQTALVAQAAFPKATPFMRRRDELGTIYEDHTFADLFPKRGQPAEAPWRLALVTIMQFAEGLTDRQAADAVRGHIDWKYALGLELTDSGFDFSVLSQFRTRLLQGKAEEKLLNTMLEHFKAKGLLKEGGRARTDSTHVLAAIRVLHRLESIGETLRAVLNDLATVVPQWLREQVSSEWYARYSTRFETYRLPKAEAERHALAEIIGQDGFQLLDAIYAPQTPLWLREIPSVDILRRNWLYQFWVEEGQVRLRKATDLPPAGVRIDSPYDPEAHYGNKRSTVWTGYKVHLTETCDENEIHLITHVETTMAGVTDVAMTEPIHQALKEKDLLPAEHLVDAGYVDAELIVKSRKDYDLELTGPVRPNSSWQASAEQGFDISHFKIDWEAQKIICPNGKISQNWRELRDAFNNEIVQARFSRTDCRLCEQRALCTKSKGDPRLIRLRPKADHEALQALRQLQTTPEWKAQYDARAGVEGSLSQGVGRFGLRECRYLGLAKTHLQHLATAAAMNIVRLSAWLEGRPHAPTRTSRFASLALAS